MPHQVHQRTFGRTTGHRRSMLRNLTLSVLRYERVRTTEARAKEVRHFVDRMIGLGKDGSLAARRRALGWLPEPRIVEKLFTDLAPRYADRSSGFTRLTRLPPRVGDSAPRMLIELLAGPEEPPPPVEEEKPRRRLRLPRRSAAKGAAEKPAEGKPDEEKKTPRKRVAAKGAKS